MATILLDDSFYEEDTGGYIDKVISFINKYFDLNVSVFHPFCNIGNVLPQRNTLALIQLRLQKTGKLEIIDKNLITPTENSIYDCLGFSQEFIGEIKYFIDNNEDVIIFVTPVKHVLKIKMPCDHVYIINHIYEEIDSNIANFIAAGDYINNIINPNINSPLPNKELCEYYYDLQRRLIDNGEDRIQVYSDVAKEVAKRNTYVFNKIVSNKNKNKSKNKKKNKREIYNVNQEVYISTDFESGCFEVYNSKGKHKGEYSYTGSQISSPDTSGKHDIKV